MRSASKYRNEPCSHNGHRFASRKERDYYIELLLRERAGEICAIELQPQFQLQPSFKNKLGKTEKAVHYVADFAYTDKRTGKRVIVETKGFKTAEYKLKRKLLLFTHPALDFLEVT